MMIKLSSTSSQGAGVGLEEGGAGGVGGAGGLAEFKDQEENSFKAHFIVLFSLLTVCF